MKKLKSGIRKDFDRIPHKSKADVLLAAGVSTNATFKRRYRLVPVLVACFIFFMFGAMLTAAITKRPAGEGEMFFSDSMGNTSGWTSTYDSVAESVEQAFYYPTWGVESEVFPYISRQEDRNSIQISYQGKIRFFWIDFDVDCSTWEPEAGAEIYEQHGTAFYIRKGYDFEVAKLGAYHVSGILDGDLYTFYIDSVENAKTVIDGLQKTEK